MVCYVCLPSEQPGEKLSLSALPLMLPPARSTAGVPTLWLRQSSHRRQTVLEAEGPLPDLHGKASSPAELQTDWPRQINREQAHSRHSHHRLDSQTDSRSITDEGMNGSAKLGRQTYWQGDLQTHRHAADFQTELQWCVISIGSNARTGQCKVNAGY